MNWQSVVSVVIDNIEYQLCLTVGTYGHNWIFTAEDITATADNSKLLPQKIYFNFDKDKKYLSCFPPKIISANTSNAIINEIKKQETSWIKGIRS